MKDLSKTIINRELFASLSLVRKSAFLFVVAVIVDAFFFIAYGFFTAPVNNKIVEHSVLLANALSPLIASGQSGLLFKLFEGALAPLTGKLIILICMLFAITYAVYCAFHGTSWYLAQQIARRNVTFRHYFLGFAKINILWMAGCVVYKLLDVVIALRHQLIVKFTPGAPNIAGTILLAGLLVWVFLAFFSYPTLRAKTALELPLRVSFPLVLLSGAVNSLPMFVGQFSVNNVVSLIGQFFINGIIVGTVQFFLNTVSKTNLDLALLFGLIFLFPTFIYLKVYSILVISHVRPRD